MGGEAKSKSKSSTKILPEQQPLWNNLYQEQIPASKGMPNQLSKMQQQLASDVAAQSMKLGNENIMATPGLDPAHAAQLQQQNQMTAIQSMIANILEQRMQSAALAIQLMSGFPKVASESTSTSKGASPWAEMGANVASSWLSKPGG